MLNYRAVGQEGRTALLLVHQLGGDLRVWDECAAIWAERYRVVAVDLRGAGRTPPADRPWHVDDHARDLIDLRRDLGLAGIVAIGCAIGSLVAATYAAMDAAEVKALVLSDTAPELGEESRLRTTARIEEVKQRGMAALLPGAIDLAFKNQPDDERRRSYAARFAANDPAGYIAIAGGMIGTDIKPCLAALACPTLVAVGEHDVLLPPSLSRQVHALVPGSAFHVIPGAAHFPPYQAPEAFAALVQGFLTHNGL